MPQPIIHSLASEDWAMVMIVGDDAAAKREVCIRNCQQKDQDQLRIDVLDSYKCDAQRNPKQRAVICDILR